MRTILYGALLAFGVPAMGLAQQVPAVVLEYEEVLTDPAGTKTVVESGTHTFANDGRQRVDRVVNGERVSRILLPASGERIEVNQTLGVGVRGPNYGSFAAPALERPGLSPRPIQPGTDEHGLVTSAINQSGSVGGVSLGSRAVGVLLLDGYRYSPSSCPGGSVRCDVELWFYHPESQTHYELIEMVRGVTEADGTNWSVERRVISAARTTVSAATFETPAGIEIRDRQRQR